MATPALTSSSSVDRAVFVSWYRRNRERSRMLFDLLASDAYYSQPIALRHPIVFYEGHLPAFSFNTLIKKALGRAGIDERLEQLFARGIDPAEADPSKSAAAVWPGRDAVRAFTDEADRRVLDALAREDLDRPGHPLLDRSEAVFAILEHEAMHQETLLYMWHRLPFAQKRKPAGYVPRTDGPIPPRDWVGVPHGRATLGVDAASVPFAWDNERPSNIADVPAFAIERHDVTNDAYLEFVESGGYATARWWRPADWAWIRQDGIAHPLFWERHGDAWFWRGMFERIPLPPSWPVYVSFAEASAFCRWRGVRLPTEAEFQRAAYGTPDRTERRYPWGIADPTTERGVFDFTSWDPEPAGSHRPGASAWGVEDLVGNGWEWTSTPFGPFPGFTPIPSYPEYSADFFDEEHFVMKGASPATGGELLRPSFRNWFRARYPYVYATFRCAKDGR
jgi:gamma-glutamyl hercynylcysteine S-oxide synthase